MTPKEKAKDIHSRMMFGGSKQNSLVAVDEILSVINVYQIQDMTPSERWQVLFWKEVKKELEKV